MSFFVLFFMIKKALAAQAPHLHLDENISKANHEYYTGYDSPTIVYGIYDKAENLKLPNNAS